MFNQCPKCYNETTVVYEDKGLKLCPSYFIVAEYGGEGSGNFGHGGRPGEVGGSSSSDEILEGGEVIDDKKGIGVVKRVSPDKLVTVKWEDGSSTVRSISELQGYGGRPGVK